MIGKTIKSLLYNSNALTALVPSAKIFPYVMDENTQMPFVVYTIDSIETENNKGGWASDLITFSVMSFATTYPLLQPIVSAVRGAIEGYHAPVGTENAGRIDLYGFDEGFILETNAFFNKLTFKVIINNYT
jgi:hypothetical protein